MKNTQKRKNCSAPQNDHLNFSFVKDIKVVVDIMTRNRCKTATYYFSEKKWKEKYLCFVS